jgi:hypothetical protein
MSDPALVKLFLQVQDEIVLQMKEWEHKEKQF